MLTKKKKVKECFAFTLDDLMSILNIHTQANFEKGKDQIPSLYRIAKNIHEYTNSPTYVMIARVCLKFILWTISYKKLGKFMNIFMVVWTCSLVFRWKKNANPKLIPSNKFSYTNNWRWTCMRYWIPSCKNVNIFANAWSLSLIDNILHAFLYILYHVCTIFLFLLKERKGFLSSEYDDTSFMIQVYFQKISPYPNAQF